MKSTKKFEDALEKLNRIASGDKEAELFSAKGKTPLAQTCIFLGEKVGFTLNPRCFGHESVEDLCKIGRLHYRTIYLEKDWWKQEHGPLLGYYQNQPAVLLYEKKGYVIYSPTQQSLPIDSTVAGEIASKAHIIYPKLPEEKKGTFRALIGIFFKNNSKIYGILFLAGALASLIGFFIPIANKILFDQAIPHFNFSLLHQVLLGLLLSLFGSTLFLFVRSFASLHLNGKISQILQMEIWDRILRLPIHFFRKMPRGDLIQRTLIFDVIRRTIGQNTLITLLDSFFASFYFLIMLYYSWRLALTTLGIILLATLFSLFIAIFKIRYDKALLESNATINSFLIATIRGIEKLRSSGAESFVFTHWAEEFSQNQKLSLKSKFLNAMIATTNRGLSLFSTLLVFGLVIWKRKQDPTAFTIGDFLAFTAAFTPFSLAIFQALDTGISLVSLVPFWQRVQPLLTTKPEVKEEQRPPGPLTGKISISDLSFHYYKNAPFVLKNVNMEIEPGEFVALVGPSGGGKTTLCRLLVGFETPESGMIRYDDVNLQDLILPELRSQISFVSQEKAVCTGTIYDNIACGEKFSYEEMQTIFKITTFDQEMARFEAGLDTLLSSGGGLLSGGERQKLLLCRALIRKPKILILDEGLNSLESSVQLEILKTLKSLNISIIFATHQLNILTIVDRVYLLQYGQITSQGNFEALQKESPYFRKLIEIQTV